MNLTLYCRVFKRNAGKQTIFLVIIGHENNAWGGTILHYSAAPYLFL
jgi:hypothetical protein